VLVRKRSIAASDNSNGATIQPDCHCHHTHKPQARAHTHSDNHQGARPQGAECSGRSTEQPQRSTNSWQERPGGGAQQTLLQRPQLK